MRVNVHVEYSSKTTFFPEGSLEFHHVEDARISVSFLCIIILGYRNPKGAVGILPSFHGNPSENNLSESHLPKRECEKQREKHINVSKQCNNCNNLKLLYR